MTHVNTRPRRCRERDGLGKGEHTSHKHLLISKLLNAQAAKLAAVFGPGGVVIDMHAHDGNGVVTPQADLFDEWALSRSTAAMAVAVAARYAGQAVLCERSPERRALLVEHFGARDGVEILRNHALLDPARHVAPFPWVIVLNDPNGHSTHGPEVLEAITRGNPRTDFIVVINEGSLHRHLAVGATGAADESPRVRASREATRKYTWMVDPGEWRRLLRKRFCVQARTLVKNGAFHGRVNLFTNHCANLSAREFTWTR